MKESTDSTLRSKCIDQIIEWRISKYGIAKGSSKQTILDKAKALRCELSGKTTAEIREIFEAEQQQQERHAALQAELEDQQRFFNQPRAKADYDHWGKAAYWTLDEAIALAFGKAPEVVTWNRLDPTYTHVSPFAKQYARVRDLALRAKARRQLSDRVIPGIFLAWAKRNGIDVPAELVRQVEARGTVVADWKDLYEKLKAQCDKERAVKDERITALVKERENLRHRIEELESLDANGRLRESERVSFLKMVLGMAIDAYGHDPTAIRSSATGGNKKSIQAALYRVGLSIDADTVRKYIKEAEGRFGDIVGKVKKI
jgi:DNA-binding transcriptional MerR regulator